jgi:AcrR family transcriptional regulator
MPKETFSVISDEKKERILDTAAREFALKGYDSANIKDIAAQAGISKGSIYDYFENKEDLYLTVSTHGISLSRKNIDSVIVENKDFFDQIRGIFLAGHDFVIKNPHYAQLYVNIASCGMERFARRLTLRVEKHTADYYKEVIHRGVKNGTIRPDVDVNMAAFIINSLYIIMMISPVSEHYRIRFSEYLEAKDTKINEKMAEHIDSLIEFIRLSLENKKTK